MIFLYVFAILMVTSITLGQDEPGAIWMPSTYFYRERNGHTAKWLIIHGTAGGSSAQNIGDWFQDPASQVATHYVVGQDGTVVQCVGEEHGAWGNGRIEDGADSWWTVDPPINPNHLTISIEHVKPSSDNSDEITPAQKAASFNLIKNIIARNPEIKKARGDSNGGITGHYSVSPITRAHCPGPFPWDELFDYLNENDNGSNGGGRSPNNVVLFLIIYIITRLFGIKY